MQYFARFHTRTVIGRHSHDLQCVLIFFFVVLNSLFHHFLSYAHPQHFQHQVALHEFLLRLRPFFLVVLLSLLVIVHIVELFFHLFVQLGANYMSNTLLNSAHQFRFFYGWWFSVVCLLILIECDICCIINHFYSFYEVSCVFIDHLVLCHEAATASDRIFIVVTKAALQGCPHFVDLQLIQLWF